MGFYKASYDDEEEGKFSEFNAAALKMKRLNKILDTLNDINGNLFAFNEEYGVFNYDLKFSQCNQLYQEVESKLTKKERINGRKMKTAITKFMNDNPAYIMRRGKPPRLDESIKNVLKKWLDEYETLVRRFIDAHGMDTKYDDESGL